MAKRRDIEGTTPDRKIPEFMGKRKEKAVAYTRVSTSHKEQWFSLAAQTDYDKKNILVNPG